MMNILILLIPLALLLSLTFLSAFLWTASNGDLENLETKAYQPFLEKDG